MNGNNSDKMGTMVEMMKKTKPAFYDGKLWPPFPGFSPDPEQKFEMRANMECRDSDVFLCSYPKAGTNWAHEVLSMIISQSAEHMYSTEINPAHVLEMNMTMEHINNLTSPRVFMTHLPYKYLPNQLKNGTGKIVYIQRNPKDLFVSFYNFQKGKQPLLTAKTWNEYFEKSVIGTEGIILGGWYNFTLEYEEQLNNENILPVYYEELKRNLAGNILKMAEFLAVPCTKELADEIADQCSFDNMKKNRTDPTSLLNDKGSNISLYRKGQVGDWKNWFTVSQNERFDEHYQKIMKDCKIQFTYAL